MYLCPVFALIGQREGEYAASRPRPPRAGRAEGDTGRVSKAASRAFVPSADAFAFANDWPQGPAVTIPLFICSIEIGNAGRGLFYGPGLINFDMSIGKRFPVQRLREGSNLEFRAEFYNLTNTPYFDNPNVVIGTATAGRITSVSAAVQPEPGAEARRIQMALKFYW